MRTTLDCLSCFLKQATYTAKLATDSPELQKEITNQIESLLPTLDRALSPPENAVFLYNKIAQISGCEDPYKNLKTAGNELAQQLSPKARQHISTAHDPLLTAIKCAIGGNIMDYGAHHDFDAVQTLSDCINKKLAINDYDRFLEDISQAESVLYLGDNCGELVFDRMFVELLDKKITFAVKEKAIINDALLSDAIDCGLDQLCTILSNGTGCPGTPLSQCSKTFQEAFNTADLIISKGQGNFETLSEIDAPIYFLLIVKCDVVAKYISEMTNTGAERIKVGNMVFMKTKTGDQI